MTCNFHNIWKHTQPLEAEDYQVKNNWCQSDTSWRILDIQDKQEFCSYTVFHNITLQTHLANNEQILLEMESLLSW